MGDTVYLETCINLAREVQSSILKLERGGEWNIRQISLNWTFVIFLLFIYYGKGVGGNKITDWCKLFPVGHNYKAIIAMKLTKQTKFFLKKVWATFDKTRDLSSIVKSGERLWNISTSFFYKKFQDFPNKKSMPFSSKI